MQVGGTYFLIYGKELHVCFLHGQQKDHSIPCELELELNHNTKTPILTTQKWATSKCFYLKRVRVSIDLATLALQLTPTYVCYTIKCQTVQQYSYLLLSGTGSGMGQFVAHSHDVPCTSLPHPSTFPSLDHPLSQPSLACPSPPPIALQPPPNLLLPKLSPPLTLPSNLLPPPPPNLPFLWARR